MAGSRLESTRVAWLDTAKAYGMFLVYYGHFVESVQEMGNEAAMAQQKLIYAFHMPLFILLSGYLAKSQMPGLWPFLRKQLASRVVPVLFFSVMMMPVGPLIDMLSGSSNGGPTTIRARWIDDWPELCARLAPPHEGDQGPAREAIWTLLPAEAQVTMEEGARDTALTEEDQQLVIGAVNALLARPDLYAAEFFAGQELPWRVQEQLSEETAGLDEDAVRRHNLTLTWWTAYPDSPFWSQSSQWVRRALMTLQGYPEFNWLTWFLICLFSVELIHFITVRFLTSAARIALAIPLFSVAGWLATMDVGRREDVWFMRESVLLYAFYLLGFLLARTNALERLQSLWSRLVLFALGGAVLVLTFPLNPCTENNIPVVLINLSQHGDPLWFGTTAVAGCIAVVAFARLTPPCRLLTLTGRYTLILMALNAFHFRHGNWALAAALEIPPSQAELLLWCTVVSIASMAVCAPAVWVLVRYLPQLVGYPRVRGPLLPRLVGEQT